LGEGIFILPNASASLNCYNK